jgi:hypothetical protein
MVAQLDDQDTAEGGKVDGVFEHDANNSKISLLAQWAREVHGVPAGICATPATSHSGVVC